MLLNYFKFIFVLIVSVFGLSSALAQDEFLDPEQAFQFSAAMATESRLDVHFKIAPQYYMYKDRFDFDIDVLNNTNDLVDNAGDIELEQIIEKVVMPDGLIKYDITFEQDLEVYYGNYTIEIHLKPDALNEFNLSIISQGCAEIGLCYSPSEHIINIKNTSAAYVASGLGVIDSVPDIGQSTPPSQYAFFQEGNQSANIFSSALNGDQNDALDNSVAINEISLDSLLQASDTGIAQYIQNAGLIKIILVCFILGVLLSFTPCVLPMVPILLAVLTGNKQTISRSKGFGLSMVFVLGMSLVYTVMGIAAGMLGASLAIWLQKPWVLITFAVFLGLFALAMFDVFSFQVPASMQTRLNNVMNRIPGGSYSGVFIMGMLSALVVGPCVAAPLAGILLFISQTGDTVLGGVALFSLAWGQGVLLLLVGASSGVLMLKAGGWMQTIKYLFGILLLVTAWWMVQSVLPLAVVMLGWALIILFSALLIWQITNVTGASAIVSKSFWRALALLLILWAVLIVIGTAMGTNSVIRPLGAVSYATLNNGSLMQADGSNTSATYSFNKINSIQELDSVLAQTSQPVMLDFYADWCVSCIQMEKFTFSNPEVASLLNNFILLQADVTDNSSEHIRLLKRFNLFGPPGIIFFDNMGNQLNNPRVVGYKNAQQFADILRSVL